MIKRRLKKLIPSKYHYSLAKQLNNFWGGFRHSYYSQYGEDVILSNFFKNQKHGFYIDVGAHHPKRYSNTYLLYQKGWHGVNIDPNPETIKLFNRARSKDINIESGIMSQKGEMAYYQFSDPAVNTFSKEEADRWMNKGWLSFKGAKQVKVEPLADILKKYFSSGTKVDLLTIDAEGFDFDVLRTNDWELFKPTVVVVESKEFNSNEPQKNNLFVFLRDKGYKLFSHIGPSLIFCLNSL